MILGVVIEHVILELLKFDKNDDECAYFIEHVILINIIIRSSLIVISSSTS